MTRDEIIAALGVRHRTVSVRGITLRLRSITGLERARYDASLMLELRDAKDDPERRKDIAARAKIRLLALSIVDENDSPIFTGDDIEALGRLDAEALQVLYDAIDEMNALTPESVEELAKNWKPSPR